MASAKVALVLDREYGEQLEHLAAQMAVWIIDSPSNKAVVRRLWDRRPKPEHMITTFMKSGVLDETCFGGLMEDIELHHGFYSQTPPFHELEVFGLKPTSVVEQILAEYGFALKQPTLVGFTAERSPETRNLKPETRN